MGKIAEYSRKRRESFVERGLCSNCGKEEPEKGFKRCSLCKIKSKSSNDKWFKTNKQKVKELKKKPSYKEKNKEYRQRWRKSVRYKAIAFFGGKCVCCDESRIEFLQLDHINGDGKKHRTEVKRGVKVYLSMLKNPQKYQIRVLCANCHFAITVEGYCPHGKLA